MASSRLLCLSALPDRPWPEKVRRGPTGADGILAAAARLRIAARLVWLPVARAAAVRGSLLCALQLLAWSLPSPASAQASRPGYAVVSDAITILVRRDFSHVEEHTRVIRVLEPEAVKELSARTFVYKGGQEDLQVLSAWTRLPEGSRHPVLPKHIRRQAHDEDYGSLRISDRQAVIVTFPKVRAGAELHVSTRRVRHVPAVPGHFARMDWWTPHVPTLDASVDVLFEAGVPLQWAVRDPEGRLKGGPVASRSGDPAGSSRLRFTHAQPKAEPHFPGQVEERDYAPMLILSTYGSWENAARAFASRAPARVTPAIAAKAREVAGSARSLMHRVEQLHNWVSTNIRYLSIVVGDGGLVPEDADTVLKRGFGDCKEKAILLEAMLASLGIRSTPVLLYLGDSFELPPLPTLQAFNHVMVYVPALDLYIDPTGGYAPVGTLPREAMAKTVLHLREGRLGRTPVMDPRTDFSETHVELVLDEGGGVRGKSTMRISGAQEASSRPEVSMAISDGIGAHIARQFQTDSEPRTVEIDAQPELLSRPWVIRLSFRLEGLVALPGPAALTLPLALAPGQSEGPGQARGRLRAFLCDGARHDETTVIHLPPAVRVRRVPESVEFKGGRLEFRASYSLHKDTLVVRRRFVSHWSGPVCPPQAGEEWMVMAKAASNDAQVRVGLTKYPN